MRVYVCAVAWAWVGLVLGHVPRLVLLGKRYHLFNS